MISCFLDQLFFQNNLSASFVIFFLKGMSPTTVFNICQILVKYNGNRAALADRHPLGQHKNSFFP